MDNGQEVLFKLPVCTAATPIVEPTSPSEGDLSSDEIRAREQRWGAWGT
jgi:hypothetical protein